MTLDGIATTAIQNAIADVEHTAVRVSQAASPSVEPQDRPDLSTELVRLLRAQRHVEVAVKIARTADETTRSTLDLVR